ncbi:MAG: hypothetical protein H6500_05485 [Candidatus Woesearchaeota archaeon]|nr:MAG: hypothetical protein H6500_05485 [Candidatus Woesearchaeota archaeon]
MKMLREFIHFVSVHLHQAVPQKSVRISHTRNKVSFSYPTQKLFATLSSLSSLQPSPKYHPSRQQHELGAPTIILLPLKAGEFKKIKHQLRILLLDCHIHFVGMDNERGENYTRSFTNQSKLAHFLSQFKNLNLLGITHLSSYSEHIKLTLFQLFYEEDLFVREFGLEYCTKVKEECLEKRNKETKTQNTNILNTKKSSSILFRNFSHNRINLEKFYAFYLDFLDGNADEELCREIKEEFQHFFHLPRKDFYYTLRSHLDKVIEDRTEYVAQRTLEEMEKTKDKVAVICYEKRYFGRLITALQKRQKGKISLYAVK